MPDNMVTIASYESAAHAGPLRMRLEQEGIYCTLANEQYYAVTGGIHLGDARGIRLQVRPEDVERAQRILEGAAVTTPMDDLDLERRAEAALQCPRCGSEEIEYQESPTGFAGACADCGHRWELA